ncbi:MAG: O-antigen ligase family protein [Gracilibacteraceae bacterium]|jgi:O-antigen ligase|nr:O-antigen ligase family protein [Gracilibacteraceae bacterium]
MPQTALLLLTLVLLAALAWRRPAWLPAFLGLAVALEISVLFYPDPGPVGRLLGELSLTKLTCVALILAALPRLVLDGAARQKLRDACRQPLTLFLLAYVGLGAASFLWSADKARTLVETARLGTLFAAFLAIIVLTNKDALLLPFRAVHGTALLLTPLTWYEWRTGVQIWQSEQLARETVLRINDTFVDPNIFARYLVLAVAAGFLLQAHAKSRREEIFYLAALPILLLQLILTSSRGGVLTLLVVVVAALILFPDKKAPLWTLAFGAVGSALIFVTRSDIVARFTALLQNLEESNPVRLYLWRAALAIFRDHPIGGTGLGSFQTVFLDQYASYRTVADGATLSHTTVLTVAAELGLAGLFLLLLLAICLSWTMFRLYALGHSTYLGIFNDYRNSYYIGLGSVLWLLTVFVSSQAEGRLFEDPVFWLAAALLVVLRIMETRTPYIS